MGELPISWPVIYAGGRGDDSPASAYGIKGIPHIMLVAPDGTIRFIQSHPFSGWTLYRIQDNTLYFKSKSNFNQKGGSQAYSRPLNADEMKKLNSLLMNVHHQNFPPKSIQYVIDGPSFCLEYVLNGQFYSVEYYLCTFPPEVEALSRFLDELYSPPSPKVRRYKRSRL